MLVCLSMFYVFDGSFVHLFACLIVWLSVCVVFVFVSVVVLI